MSAPLCECGCGLPVKQVRRTSGGYYKGEYTRFLKGHHRNKRNGRPRWTVEDRGHDTPCWVWAGYTSSDGYAKSNGGYVHRRHYEERHGPVPEGLQLDHLCRERACVNPDHLEAVTHAENQRRGREARANAYAV